MASPFLSVIIPVYNNPGYIVPCVESILNSKVRDVEIIIVDDCSTDNTLDVCEKLAGEDSRVSVIPLERNSGQGFARNIGLRAAKGEYVFFVDSDDEVIPEDFSALMGNRQVWGGVDTVVFNYITSNLSVKKAYRREDNNYKEEKFLIGKDLGGYYPDKAMWVYLFNRDFLLRNKLHPFSLKVSEDRFFVCEAMQAASSLYISPLHVYHYIRRVGGMSMSKTTMEEWVDFLDWYRHRLMPYEKWDEKPAVKRTMERLIQSCSLECTGEFPKLSNVLSAQRGLLEMLCTAGAEAAVVYGIQSYRELIYDNSDGYAKPIYICPAGATSRRIGVRLLATEIPIKGFLDNQKTGTVSAECVGQKVLPIWPFEADSECFKQDSCFLICGGTIVVDELLADRLKKFGVRQENIVTM